MTTRTPSLPRVLILIALLGVLLLPSVTVTAKEQGFDAIVKHIETYYRVKRTHIPFMGVAGFAVKFVRPAGVKDFKLATFDDQDFSRPVNDAAFESDLRGALEKGWQPLVRRRTRRDGESERLYIYTKHDGKDTQLLTIVIEARQAVVVEAKIDQAAMAKFMDKPEIMGISLAGNLSGKSLIGALNGGMNGSNNSGNSAGNSVSNKSSGDSLASQLPADIASTPQTFTGTPRKTETPAASPDAAPQAVLHTKSSEAEETTTSTGANSEPSRERNSPPPDKDTIRLDTRLVNLNVKATDRAGRALSTLKPEDFEIYEDGVKQEVAFFEPVSAPINLVLLLDLSGSTQDRRKIMVEAVKKFVDALSPKDQIAIAAFTRDFYVISDFTTDHKLLKNRVDKVKKIHGGTAYYDAMWTTLDLLREVKAQRKAIVVMTDGIDNSVDRSGRYQTKHTFSQLMERVSEEEVTIYPIDVGKEPQEIRMGNKVPFEVVTRINERVRRPAEIGHQELQALAEQTAGMVFKASREEELHGVYQRVAAELHLLYSLAYDPKNTRNNGEFRKVNIKVNRDGALARTRPGYYAK